MYTDSEDEMVNGHNEVLNECHEHIATINVCMPGDVSIDLPPLDWSFQHELPDLSCIGIDSEQAHVISNETVGDHQSLSMLRYTLQFSDPIGKWFVLPSDDASRILLCSYSFNTASSPVITYTIEIQSSHEWVLRIPYGALHWKCHPVLKELPVTLVSRNDVMAVTDTIEDCKQCDGISDQKFGILVTKHKGRFLDFTGQYHNNYQCACKKVHL